MKIKEVFSKGNISVTDEQEKKFVRFYELILEWNEKFNLTKIVSEKDVVLKHFYDSVTALPHIPQYCYVCDVGSGAGFPAIPIGIMRPDLNITMVEATGKKVDFLNECIKELALPNMSAVKARAEDLAVRGAAQYYGREMFNIITARAVAELNSLVEYCLPLVRVGGKMIAYKAEKADEELSKAQKAISSLGGSVDKTYKFCLPDTNVQRALITINKILPTPSKYPRAGGAARSNPL